MGVNGGLGAGRSAEPGTAATTATATATATASGESARPMTFRIDIGELVLTGFGRGLDPDRVTAAFETELTRLVREHGVPLAAEGTGRALDTVTGLPPLPANLSARRLGQELARAVHEGLTGRGEAQ